DKQLVQRLQCYRLRNEPITVRLEAWRAIPLLLARRRVDSPKAVHYFPFEARLQARIPSPERRFEFHPGWLEAGPQNPLTIRDFEVTIDENPAENQSLGTLDASSSDGSTFTYALSAESPQGALAVSSTGELTVADASLFDFEQNPTISATVTITNGEFSDDGSVTVLLTDVFEGTIWSGPTLSFTKENGADPTAEENQDRLTDNVWITRGNGGGQIYNAVSESSAAQSTSPEGTEWAQGSIDDVTTLVFQPFRAAVGRPQDVVGQQLVLHLIEDDIYLSVEFTSWAGNGQNGNGGGFAYDRSTPNE
ncbi:MAG: hypothetical protein AAGA85_23590, partial [Bacteroidota bacterium]